MSLTLSALVLAAAVLAASWFIARAIARSGTDRLTLQLVAIFAPAIDAVRDNPRALLAWYPVALTARGLFPEAFRRIDAARRATFPFTADEVQSAHARCTAEWLAWERTHDAEYKLKATALEEEIARGPEAGTSVGRARIDAVEREKLERYQQRYEDYIRTAKALQALLDM